MLLHIILRVLFVAKAYCQTDNYYNAAVVGMNTIQANVSSTLSSNEWLLLTTARFNDLVEKAYIKSGRDLDIILFPESALSGDGVVDYSSEIPEPNTESICGSRSTKYEPFLKELSCIASRFETTLVVNIVERYNCTFDRADCRKPGTIYYNTNVAFNETGHVIARYRKWNLFGETLLSPAPKPESITFVTKNGFEFGMFTCFDIIFDKPPLDLVRRKGIRNVIFPNRWFSELPFLTALQVQQMWAHENNVTLLAAGFNSPVTASWGTGVYIGGNGPAYIELNYEDDPMVGVVSVPVLDPANESHVFEHQYDSLPEDYDENLKDFHIWKDISIPQFRSSVLNTDQTHIFEEICDEYDNQLCCQFNLSISAIQAGAGESKNRYVYHLVAFNGVRSFSGVRHCGIELCGIIACFNDSLESCGQRYTDPSDVSWNILFEKINISASFIAGSDRIQYPNSLLSNLSPVSPSNTTWSRVESDGVVKRSHVLSKPVKKLLTFGIFGRVFTRDDQVFVSNSTEIIRV